MKFRLDVVTSVLLFGGLGLALWAQDGKKGPEQKESVYAELGKVPEKERQKTNPLAKDPEAVAAGEVLFEEHCEECHGTRGMGGKKMPVWSKLPEPERWQLVSYVKSLGIAEAASDDRSTKP